MASLNKAIIVGRLGADPEVRTTQTGQMVATINLATSEGSMKDGKREERTEWHRIVLWGKQAELAQRYLKKGRLVCVEGRIQTRNWQDAQGQKKYTTEIVANNLQFLDGGGSAGQREDIPNIQQDESSSPYGGGNASYGRSGASQVYEPHDSIQDPFQSPRIPGDDVPF